VLLAVTCTTAAAYCTATLAGARLLAALLPWLTYGCVAAVVLLPLPVLHRPSRHFFAATAARVLLPFQVGWVAYGCMPMHMIIQSKCLAGSCVAFAHASVLNPIIPAIQLCTPNRFSGGHLGGFPAG
jgi:hypothetical protein